MAVDDREDFLRLLGHAFAGGLVGDDAGQIDGVAVHDGLAHARAGFDTLNAHGVLPKMVRRLFSVLMRGCQRRPVAFVGWVRRSRNPPFTQSMSRRITASPNPP